MNLKNHVQKNDDCTWAKCSNQCHKDLIIASGQLMFDKNIGNWKNSSRECTRVTVEAAKCLPLNRCKHCKPIFYFNTNHILYTDIMSAN